jgi:hypothetical protein
MQTLRRLFIPLVALGTLAFVVHWLMSKPEVRFRLGPGLDLVARDGVDGFLVHEGDGAWRLYDSRSHAPQDGVAIEAVIGRPALAADGGAFALQRDGLLRLPHPGSPTAPQRFGVPAGSSLLGAAGGHQPVLEAPDADGARLLLVLVGASGSNGHGGPRFVPLVDAAGPARLPDDAAPDDAVCAAGGPALALRTPSGWEAWSWDESGAARRALAEGCFRPGAVFTPDARALIVPGKVEGLWLLALVDGRMSFMAEGNFGYSRRVPSSTAFRGAGEHVRLVAPQWNLDGWLQIYQTHLLGGGRAAFGLSFTHHYGAALSEDGRFMAYCQAQFEERGDGAFEEELFVVDFEQDVRTVSVGSRHGGVPWQGPHFVGPGASLVYLAGGEVQRIELLPPAAGE